MPEPTQSPSDNVIRITKEETAGSHVEDLLRRQMSMRGEAGVARDRRKWYYQNWFVFMIVGALAAIAAWAIIEPYFEDMLYVQGPIADVDTQEEMPSTFSADGEYMKWRVSAHARIRIGDDEIWLADDTRELRKDGTKPVVKASSLSQGQEIGVYVEYHQLGTQSMAVARFVVLSPHPLRAGQPHLDLERLNARSHAAGMLLFPLVAGFIGLAIGAVDGAICRLARRALLAGLIGLFAGFVGGFISEIVANLAYAPLHKLAMAQITPGAGGITTFAFVVQMTGRALAWCLAGLAMGLGQGIALRSGRLLLYGLIGGVVGGLFGGLLFDPIDILLLGADKPSAHWSRLIGFAIIGAGVGGMIGLVELLARDAWLRMSEGPLAGKEFLIFKDNMQVGSSPRSDIYLFNDPQVAAQHATLRMIGDDCEIEARGPQSLVLLNNRPVNRSRLRHGDQIGIGRTVFVFQKRKN